MAGIYDITIEQGTNFSLNLTYKDSAQAPIDLTGYTAKMQMRPFASSARVFFERSTTNGTISLGGAAGTVLITATAEETAALNFLNAVYDIELYSPIDTTIRLLQGKVIMSQEVTRD